MEKWERFKEYKGLARMKYDKEHKESLARYPEVIDYNRKNLTRELQNESRQYNRQQGRTKRREEELN